MSSRNLRKTASGVNRRPRPSHGEPHHRQRLVGVRLLADGLGVEPAVDRVPHHVREETSNNTTPSGASTRGAASRNGSITARPSSPPESARSCQSSHSFSGSVGRYGGLNRSVSTASSASADTRSTRAASTPRARASRQACGLRSVPTTWSTASTACSCSATQPEPVPTSQATPRACVAPASASSPESSAGW